MISRTSLLVILAVTAISLADEETWSCKSEDTGTEYQNGEGFMADDGCNRCTCTDGMIACTEMACLPPQGCHHKGRDFELGDTFMDECNTCHCEENGEAICTIMACETL